MQEKVIKPLLMKHLFIFFLVAVNIHTKAQNIGIGTNTPLRSLHLNSGTFMVTGDTGTAPTLGAGSKFLWVPARSALRAGYTTGSGNWNHANLGQYSFAYGSQSNATGNYGFAGGNASFANGENSIAIGNSVIANGTSAVAIGRNINADAYGSFAIGRFAETNGNSTTWVETDPLFVVGNGFLQTDPFPLAVYRNALTILKSGYTRIGGRTSINGSVEVGIGEGASIGLEGQKLYVHEGNIKVYSSAGTGGRLVLDNSNENVIIGVNNLGNAPNNASVSPSTNNSVFIGAGAGSLTNGFSSTSQHAANNCVFVGADTKFTPQSNCSNCGISNTTLIGYQASSINQSNAVHLGNTAVTSIGGWVGWSTFSDLRTKMNITEEVVGLPFILKLRPVTYHYDVEVINKKLGIMPDKNPATEKMNQVAFTRKSAITYSGFIAQEVEAAATVNNYSFSGIEKPQNGEGYYSLRYESFVVPLVKAVQEQQSQINELKKANTELLEMINELKKEVLTLTRKKP